MNHCGSVSEDDIRHRVLVLDIQTQIVLYIYIRTHTEEKPSTLLKQTIEKSIYKDCGEGKILIRLKIQSWRLNFQTNFNQICIRIQSLRLNFQSY